VLSRNVSGPGNSTLDQPVESFVVPVAEVLGALTARTGRTPTASATDDVTVEAFNLVCAVLDADDRQTDDEIWALLATFGPRFATQLGYATPADVRKSGILSGKRTWLAAPSTLFDLLVAADRRDRTNHSWTYYRGAISLSHHVASIDMSPTETELRALDGFRSMLVNTLERAGIPREGERPRIAGPSEASPERPRPTSGADQSGTAAAGAPAAEPVPGPETTAPPEPIEDLLAELDALVGLEAVKREVRLVTNLLQVHKLRRDRDLPTPDSSLHLIFAGNPGTGKTTVARLLARIYRSLGVVERGHLVETDRAGLVAGFVGQTALKVTEVFDRADQGVLLIDEAYSLARGGERDFGQEAVDTIVKLIEDRRDRLVVVAAGYPEEMATFIGTNPGLRSRFPKTIVFDDYSNDELVSIFKGLCAKNRYEPTKAALRRVKEYFATQERTKGFGNGRVARNVFEAAMAAQATRIMSRGADAAAPSDAELLAIEAADITKSVPVSADRREQA
jgi:ATPase family associated with various cellular activities (AAA)/AAA lid domain